MLSGKLKSDIKKKKKRIRELPKEKQNLFHEFEVQHDKLKGDEHIDYLLDNAFILYNPELSYSDKQEIIQKPRRFVQVEKKDEGFEREYA